MKILDIMKNKAKLTTEYKQVHINNNLTIKKQ